MSKKMCHQSSNYVPDLDFTEKTVEKAEIYSKDGYEKT